MRFKKVLIAVDNDPIAAHSAETGMNLARALHAQVALIHVIDPSTTFAPDTSVTDELALLAEQDGRRLMADFCARLPAGMHALQFIPQGPPGAEITKAAKEWEADLIVIGSHGRSGITRALLGSVADAVMREAPCPVLVVRAKE